MENAGLVVRVFVCRRFQRVDAGSPEQIALNFGFAGTSSLHAVGWKLTTCHNWKL
jgi:hypothetical protein